MRTSDGTRNSSTKRQQRRSVKKELVVEDGNGALGIEGYRLRSIFKPENLVKVLNVHIYIYIYSFNYLFIFVCVSDHNFHVSRQILKWHILCKVKVLHSVFCVFSFSLLSFLLFSFITYIEPIAGRS